MWPRRYLYEQNIINYNSSCYLWTRIRLKDFLYDLNYHQSLWCKTHSKLKYFYFSSVCQWPRRYLSERTIINYNSFCYVWTRRLRARKRIRLKDVLYDLNYHQSLLCTNYSKLKYFYFSSVTKKICIWTKYNKWS